MFDAVPREDIPAVSIIAVRAENRIQRSAENAGFGITTPQVIDPFQILGREPSHVAKAAILVGRERAHGCVVTSSGVLTTSTRTGSGAVVTGIAGTAVASAVAAVEAARAVATVF